MKLSIIALSVAALLACGVANAAAKVKSHSNTNNNKVTSHCNSHNKKVTSHCNSNKNKVVSHSNSHNKKGTSGGGFNSDSQQG